MKPIIIAAAMAAVLLGSAASPALAQRSEAGDRGLRLENDALRTDVRQDRLKKPAAKPSAAKLKRRPKVSDRTE
jgi:outer membrane murein-binding lipoprotein Lpp